MGLFSRKKTEKKDKQTKKPADIKIKDKKKENPDVKSGSRPRVGKTHGSAYKNLIRPIITEQASELGADNQYVFEVRADTNKSEIKKAIHSLYGVKPLKVNTINMRGKMVRYGRRYGKLKNWKKAIIILRSGDKIDVYEGV
ncbi:50S ribosomal protein L23 [Candidatus Parcubacteria bacterium]|nr:50S ribosomal protein L23 [Patescibacteria group bacterium]MCG2686939.1 50S ribosomal protein L23 [Candidatus Parcubacteria bacterium]